MSDAIAVNGTEEKVSAAPVVEATTPGLVVDRGRMTHKQAKRFGRVYMGLHTASEAGDFELLDSLTEEYEATIRRIVVSVPDGWLPDGVTMDDEDWLDQIAQTHFDLIVREIVFGSVPGKKTD